MKRWILAILLVLAYWLAPDGPNASAVDLPDTRMPACPEDAVLVGVGSFDNGRWTEYTCGPAVDDYQED